MSRERLPTRRASVTLEFEHAGLAYTCSYSCFGDGRPGEIFLQNHKGGSGADVGVREAAIAASLALQHGCAIQVLQRALLMNLNGEAAGALGRAIGLIVEAADEATVDTIERQQLAAHDPGEPDATELPR